MKILDWYILKKFLSTYLFVVLILISIICVIDFTENSEDFAKGTAGLKAILLDYYLPLFPYYANLLSPITVFIAVVFITAKMASHTEIVAMLSGGVSFNRFLRPYIMGSILLGLITLGLIGWVVPEANKVRVAFELEHLKNPHRFRERDFHVKLNEHDYAYMESYNNEIHTGYKFSLEHFENGELKWKMLANKIQWLEKIGKWRINQYQLRRFEGEEEFYSEGMHLDTTLNLYPKDFESTYRLAETLTLPELEDYIDERIERGADDVETYQTEKYERLMYPFAIIVLTIIGVIMSARKSRQGVGFQIALGFLLAFIYLIFVILSRNLAQVGDMSPQLAAAFPTIVYIFVGLFLYKTVPR